MAETVTEPKHDWGYQVRDEQVDAAVDAWEAYKASPGDKAKHSAWMHAEHELTTPEHTEYIRRGARRAQEKNS